jgi:hypothetical protein
MVTVSDVPPGAGPVLPPDPDPDHTRVLPPDRSPDGPKQRFVDRLWTFRALIAVALASVILGGLGGAALANAGSKDDNRRGGPFPGRMGQRPGNPMMPPGNGGRLLPPGNQQWQWDDSPHRRGMGQWQWDEGQNPGVVPPGTTPTPTPTPKN